jgi:hypothetical protein
MPRRLSYADRSAGRSVVALDRVLGGALLAGAAAALGPVLSLRR